MKFLISLLNEMVLVVRLTKYNAPPGGEYTFIMTILSSLLVPKIVSKILKLKYTHSEYLHI